VRVSGGSLDIVSPAQAAEAEQPPAWLSTSWVQASALGAARVDAAVERARKALREGRPRAAAFAIGERLDDYLRDGAYDAAQPCFGRSIRQSFLGRCSLRRSSRHGPTPEPLRAAREDFLARALDALHTRWRLNPSEIADLEARLR
jgi:hypothetical protein